MTVDRPAHSPLGASSAERWLSCPGSVALIKKLAIAETTDEPEYRGLGVAAHEAAAHCLKEGLDAWEIIGERFHTSPKASPIPTGYEVDKEMADAIQVYLDTVRPAIAQPGARVYVEYSISHPAHHLFYGTLDCGVIYGVVAEINDYKHGEGLAVDVEDNAQLKYYAYGFLREHPQVKNVLLRIIQPRISWREAVQEWWITADEIKQWAEQVLIPAMQVAELEGGDLDAGDWCRFCPAKLVCPLLKGLFQAAATTNPKQIIELSNDTLGREHGFIQGVKFYTKALEEEIYNRLNRGGAVPGCKLVPKKANRVFKPEAFEAAKEKFGEDAFTAPEMKSPAELDKLGAGGKEFTRQFAYTPQTGLTVAAESDNRVAVKVPTTSEAFGKAIEQLTL